MVRAVVNYSKILALLLVVGLLGITLLCQDIATKHPEATTIRTYYRTSTCEGTEIWFAAPRGTILVLCGIPGSPDWGGMIYRVTTSNGTRLLNSESYEVTVFVASKRYWSNVITRDGYVPLANYPSIHRFFREWWDY